MSIADKKCQPCNSKTPPLSAKHAEKLLEELNADWQIVEGHYLRREFRFKDFAIALKFVNRIGEIAESENHHPDIHLAWGRVVVKIWTHAIDALSENDFILAAKIDKL